MKCQKCSKEAVDFHGVGSISHGYCYEHRCCGKCGLSVQQCDCKESILVRFLRLVGLKTGPRHTEREAWSRKA